MSSFQQQPFGFALNYRSQAEEMSVGRFFNAVYAWMCVGLATTAAVALGVYEYAPGLMHSGVGLISLLVMVVLVVTIQSAINRISTPAAIGLFVLFAALMGVSMSTLFAVYAKATIGVVFLETAGLFGAVSLYGMTTGRNLAKLGTFLFMALLGLVIASVVNFFMASTTLMWVINYAGILIFVGLTAVDTQRLKLFAQQNGSNARLASRVAVVGSLMLYLDFINLFVFLLQVFGGNGRRD